MLPSAADFRERIAENADEEIADARAVASLVRVRTKKTPIIRVLNRTAHEIEDDRYLSGLKSPRLIVTSPPYPGIHVLYHRWQVDGGKESPLPFLIANKLDGAGSSCYTMGDRRYPEL